MSAPENELNETKNIPSVKIEEDNELNRDNLNGSSHVIKEGTTEILVPPGTQVFYNPVQEFNRDLSIAVLEILSKETPKPKNDETKPGIRILEALSATGLRSIRYAKEIPGVAEILANDISIQAVENIQKNIIHNHVEDIVKTSHKDAREVMFENRHWKNQFDAVDLDPYGCATPFLDSAVGCVKDGGILLVTCTDMAVLCSNPVTCHVKYGAVTLKHHSCHEMALRIVLQCIESYANKYKRHIIPLLSISADFYVRVFVKVYTSASKCKQTISKLSMVWQCTGCETVTLQPLGATSLSPKGIRTHSIPTGPAVGMQCEHCGSKHQMGGPIWSAPIHDPNFVDKLLTLVENKDAGTQKRLMGILTMVREELTDVPLYYTIDKLCSTIKSSSISMMMFRSALLNAGYRVSFSHANRISIKTDAPMTFIWDILRTWVKQDPNKSSPLSGLNEKSPGYAILSKEPAANVDFTLRSDANPVSRERKLVRFQENPLPFWGPGSKGSTNQEKQSKKERNQNKRKRNKCESEGSDCGPLKTPKSECEEA